MEFKFNKETSFELPEGVDAHKFLANQEIAVTPEEVREVFSRHNYHFDMTGEFLKQMTANTKEINELDEVLSEIEKMGLKSVFEKNLRVATFKKAFVERLKIFMNNNFPYLMEDNTFVPELYLVGFAQRLQFCIDNGFVYQENGKFKKELYDVTLFAEYTTHKPMEMIKTAREAGYVDVHESDNTEHKMDAEDLEVYHDIVVKLNGLILQNPMDEVLPIVVKNILANVNGAIIAKQYHHGVYSMLKPILDGIELSDFDKTRIEQLISDAFPLERVEVEGRSMA